MSLNVFNLSGTVEKVSFLPAGSQTSGGFTMRYPQLSARIGFGVVQVPVGGGRYIPVGPQDLYLQISLGQNNIVQKAQGLEAKFNQGAGWYLLSNGTFSQWTDRSGNVKSELKCSFADFDLGRSSLAQLNSCTIQGTVKQHQPPWIWVEERYRNPSEQDPAKQWKSRLIPAYCIAPIPNLLGHNALVIGKVSVYTPIPQMDGTFRNVPFLHVVAEEVHACLG